jgi:hypothetical protein
MLINPQPAMALPTKSTKLPPDVRVAVIGLIGTLILSTVATAVLFFISSGFAHASSRIPHPANCGGLPCNGEEEWPNAIWGAQAEIQTQALQGSPGTSIYNRLQLTDYGHICGPVGGPAYFAAGYRTRDDNAQTYYYWEDCVPGGSSSLIRWQYQVPSNNYGTYWRYRMYRYNSSTYEVDFFYTSGTYYWSGISYGNGMLPNAIDLGEQTTSQSADSSTTYTYYRSSQWEDNVNGAWHWQNSNGTTPPYNDHPPSFGWNQPPASYPNTGGLGNTCWC